MRVLLSFIRNYAAHIGILTFGAVFVFLLRGAFLLATIGAGVIFALFLFQIVAQRFESRAQLRASIALAEQDLEIQRRLLAEQEDKHFLDRVLMEIKLDDDDNTEVLAELEEAIQAILDVYGEDGADIARLCRHLPDDLPTLQIQPVLRKMVGGHEVVERQGKFYLSEYVERAE